MKKVVYLSSLSFKRSRLAESYCAGAFTIGLIIDLIYDGKIKGWIGIAIELAIPFILASFAGLAVNDSYNQGREEGRRQNKTSSHS